MDEPFDMTIRRGGEEQTFTCTVKMVENVQRFVFRVNPNATPAHVALSEVWLRNLPVG